MPDSMRDASRKGYVTRGDSASIEEINVGSLQRIADAVEVMASDYVKLRRDRDFYEAECNRLRSNVASRDYRIRALLGVITRLKRTKKEPDSA